jgi:hypothetical protein
MLIGARNAVWGGKRLPYDAEVEYLESTGTQWIDTGLLCSGADEVSISCFIPSDDGLGTSIFWGAGGNSRVWATSGYCRFGNENMIDITYKRLLNNWNTIRLNQSTGIVNGASLSMSIGTFQGKSNLTSLIFRGNDMLSNIPPSMKVSSFFWKRNGVLILDLIPVRVGNVGYMYDKVSGKLFGNAGTGDFVLGPDVVPVEYIESHGTEWIDTGYVYNADSKFVCDAMLMSVPSDIFAVMFGAVLKNYNGVFIALNNTVPIQARFGASSVGNIVSDLSVQNAVGVRHKYELSARRLAIDDDVFTRIGFTPYTVNRSIWLCSCNDSESGNLNRRPCSLRVYAFDINNGNTAVHKYLPVRVGSGSTWEGAMMDVLTRRIYRNQGTGAFVVAPDL